MDAGIFADLQPPSVPIHESFVRQWPNQFLRHAESDFDVDALRGHGTACFGIVFSTGDGADSSISSVAKGILYDPTAVGIFAAYGRLATTSREQHIKELVSNDGPYWGVFESNSWGSGVSLDYTTDTKEIDDILFRYDVLVCNSQSNSGSQLSRPEAWAKNIVSVGGIKGLDTPDRNDDRWGGCYRRPSGNGNDGSYLCINPLACDDENCDCQGCPAPPPGENNNCSPNTSARASTGPAADGRIKPDLAHLFDGVFTTYWRSANLGGSYRYYACRFEATSCATPIVAGCFGLFFQMWHEQVFPGFGGQSDVFSSRSHMTTAKAMLINTAHRYDWDPVDPTYPNPDLTRERQGWGMPDLAELYDSRDHMLIIDEKDILSSIGQQVAYQVTVVGPNPPPFRATLVYADPGGETGSTLHRINDLSLKVGSPSGIIYYGNNGLGAGNWSSPGGTADTKNTVENVFVQTPEPGVWSVKVVLNELNQDGHLETQAMDADFALVVSRVESTGSSVRGDWDGNGDVDTGDFASFMEAYLNGSADADGNGKTEAEDVFKFIDAFLAGRR